MSIVLKNAAPILTCLSLGVMLLPSKWPTVKIIVGAADVLYAVVLLLQSFSASA